MHILLMKEKDANPPVAASAHVFGHPAVIRTQASVSMERHRDLFAPAQLESVVSMMRNVADAGGPADPDQLAVIDEAAQELGVSAEKPAWG